MPRQNSDSKQEFLRLLFTLWVEAQKARANREITVTNESNYKQCIKFEWEQNKIQQQEGNLSYIQINNQQIQCAISSDNFLIIKLEQEDGVFLAICVVQELGNYVFKITGLDFTDNNQGQEGLKTEYLIKLTEKLGITTSIRSTGSDPKQKLNKRLIKPLERGQVCKKEDKHRNVYFDFTFLLQEDLKTRENIINNVNHYMTILAKDTVTEIDYDLPNLLQNQSGYIERPNIESECYEKINTGDFIRIKGSVGMGKTCLLKQIIQYASSQTYLTIKLDLNEPEKSVFDDLKAFYTWFCKKISRSLDIEKSDNFIAYVDYNNDPSNNANITYYFEDHLLNNINNQLKIVLAIDNVDRLFTFANIANDVCGLWRSWYDENNGKIRNNMIMIITHSTMDYPNFNINSSPLDGIGHVASLSDWQVPEVESITQQYNLNLSAREIEQLMSFIGGHPYLVRKAVEYLHETSTNVENLLKIATNEDSPFSSYLDQLLQHLEDLPELCNIYNLIINGSLIRLDRTSKFHLDSLGLIKIIGNQILPKYYLYQNYFLAHLNQGE